MEPCASQNEQQQQSQKAGRSSAPMKPFPTFSSAGMDRNYGAGFQSNTSHIKLYESAEAEPSTVSYTPHGTPGSEDEDDLVEEPKPQAGKLKRRRQNAACDSCRLRRVKCDLSTKELGQACSKCDVKRINCTTESIANKKPPKRTGSRIELSKRIHGLVDEEEDESQSQLMPTDALVMPDPMDRSASVVLVGAAKNRFLITLINSFFIDAHYSTPVVDPIDFQAMFNAAGQDVLRVKGPSLALCYILAAIGARYSSDPLIVSTPPNDFASSSTSKSLFEQNYKREAACQALVDKAIEMVDSTGVLRIPCMMSITCMLLIIPLVRWRVTIRSTEDRNMRNKEDLLTVRVMEAATNSHLRILGSFESLPTLVLEELTLPNYLENLRLQRPIWTAWISDSFDALRHRREPLYRDNDLLSKFPDLPRFGHQHQLPNELSPLKAFAVFSTGWGMICSLNHYASHAIVIPNTRRNNGKALFSMEVMDANYRLVWNNMNSFWDYIDGVFVRAAPVFDILPPSQLFSPVLWYLNLKFGYVLSVLCLHGILSERYLSTLAIQPPPPDLSMVINLYHYSNEVIFTFSRRIAVIVGTLLDGDYFKSSGPALRELAVIGEFLSSQNTVALEQEPIVEGHDGSWTWKNKLQEVGWLVQALQQMAPSWGTISSVIQNIENSMRSTQPVNVLSWDSWKKNCATSRPEGASELSQLLQHAAPRSRAPLFTGQNESPHQRQLAIISPGSFTTHIAAVTKNEPREEEISTQVISALELPHPIPQDSQSQQSSIVSVSNPRTPPTAHQETAFYAEAFAVRVNADGVSTIGDTSSSSKPLPPSQSSQSESPLPSSAVGFQPTYHVESSAPYWNVNRRYVMVPADGDAVFSLPPYQSPSGVSE